MKTFFKAFRIFCVLTILTGILYPVGITLVAQIFFPKQANGSLVKKDGRLIGSELLAQKFQDPKYFWSRPSAGDFATVPSGASNLGPTSAALKEAVLKRAADFRKGNRLASETLLPADVVFASASGLDPHISPEAARLQIARIVEARHWDEAHAQKLKEWVQKYTEPPQFGIFGKPRINVFRLNLALDSL